MFRFMLLVLLISLSLSGCAVPPQGEQTDIATVLIDHYPQIKYQQINPTPVAGIYEVIVEGGELVYFDPVSGNMFFGELWTADLRNLTQESKDRFMATKLETLPLDQAIKIGNGPHQVVEMTDPDCPYCRKSSDFFANRDDVTRYIFLFPLDKIHPQAAAKSRYILAAKDPGLAYEEVFSGQFDARPVPVVTDNTRLDLHRQAAKKLGIHGTPQFWINGHHVAGFNPQQFNLLLGQ